MRMQSSKVSVVIPCYNKESYISTMLNTILAQTWDRIELVFVNDGSTDETRKIIAEYKQRFESKGYEVVIIDQENAGVCAAARNGLLRITGDYVCLVDSDDELDPEYVSTMAQWLDENPDYDIAICSGVNFKETDSGREFWHFPPKVLPADDNEIKAEHFIVGRYIRNTVWVYMLRASYLKRTRIIETYYVDTWGSHEPGYVIPLHAYGGKKKYFPLALYKFNGSGDGHSQFRDMNQAQRFYDEYHVLCTRAIAALPDEVAKTEYKRFLHRASLLSRDIHLYRIAVVLNVDESLRIEYSKKLLRACDEAFNLNSRIAIDRVLGYEEALIAAAINCIFSTESELDDSIYPELSYSQLRL